MVFLVYSFAGAVTRDRCCFAAGMAWALGVEAFFWPVAASLLARLRGGGSQIRCGGFG